MNIQYVLTFILIALADYRLSVMITNEYGPFDVFENLRNWLPKSSMPGKLVRCPFCVSMWLGFIGALFLPDYGFGWYLTVSFALSGVATLLVKRFG